MKFILKKTNELTQVEKTQICDLFFRVFNKPKTLGDFEGQFAASVLGFSYHGLMVDEGKIVGSYTSVPFKYKYFDKECVFALSVDTMIDDNYRGNPFALKKMARLVYAGLQAEGIPFVFGFPNDNVYLVRKKVLKWRDIGKLNYYILPVNVGALKAKLKIFNVFSFAFASLINLLAKRVNAKRDAGVVGYPIEKIVDDAFVGYRYSNACKKVDLGENRFFVYRIIKENQARVAYLIDVFPLQKKIIENAVSYIFDNEKSNIDVIMYVGKLKFGLINLFKVPRRLEPKSIHMSGEILDTAKVDDKIFNIKNWNVNLSNFDTR